MGLLQSPHLDVRMAAGEMIALLMEVGRGHDEEFLDDCLDDLVEKTKMLATDSQKFRAKKDRKQQRATFRDVLHYVSLFIFNQFLKENFIIPKNLSA